MTALSVTAQLCDLLTIRDNSKLPTASRIPTAQPAAAPSRPNCCAQTDRPVASACGTTRCLDGANQKLTSPQAHINKLRGVCQRSRGAQHRGPPPSPMASTITRRLCLIDARVRATRLRQTTHRRRQERAGFEGLSPNRLCCAWRKTEYSGWTRSRPPNRTGQPVLSRGPSTLRRLCSPCRPGPSGAWPTTARSA